MKKTHSFVASDVSSFLFHSVSFSLLLSHRVITRLVLFSVSSLAKTLIRPRHPSPTPCHFLKTTHTHTHTHMDVCARRDLADSSKKMTCLTLTVFSQGQGESERLERLHSCAHHMNCEEGQIG